MALPRILHHNILAQAASVVASSSAAGFPVANLSDGRPYTWWKPSAMPATIEVDAGVAVDADGLYIPAHTLDSTFCDVSVYAADLPFSGMQLLTAPEDFSNAAWTKNFSTVTVNAIAAPDGTTTADKLVESAATNIHDVEQAEAMVSGTVHTLSVYAKAGERSALTLRLIGTGTWGRAVFNLATGAFSASAGTATMVLDANGFYRCSITGTCDLTGTNYAYIYIASSYSPETINYTGDGTSGLYCWGAMLNAGSAAAPYIPVTAGRWISETALAFSCRIAKPRDLADAASGSGSATVTANSGVARNGQREATLVTDSSAAANQFRTLGSHNERHSAEDGITASLFITKTVGDVNYSHMHTYVAGASASYWCGVTIDTNNGVVTATTPNSGVYATPADYGVEDAGDAWFVWLKHPAVAAPSGSSMLLYIYPAYNTNGAFSGGVAATGSKVFWGAKLEKTLSRPAPFREDAPLYLPFTSTRKRYWLLRFNRKTGAALPAIGELVLGKSLELPVGMPQGLDPIGRRVVGSRNANERGQPMGRSVDFESSEYEITQEEVDWAWVRNVWQQAWRNGLRSEPFGFVWDYESHVEDVLLVTAAEDWRAPHKSGGRCTLRLRVQGVPT